VVDKEVTSHELDQLLCRKMIPDIGKTDAGGNAQDLARAQRREALGTQKLLPRLSTSLAR